MTEINLELWKQANRVYAQLMDLTVSDALSQLSQMESLDDEVKSLILTLISSGNQPSQYFKQHISANFQLDEWLEKDFKIGEEVGGYELLEELGVGGMAKVYKARKLDVDSQKLVAMKLFNHQALSSIMVNRFAVEQDILAGLTHPNIVNMHHGGTSNQGVPYIVMELIDQATDIDKYSKANKASTKQKIRWIIDAARAIAYAHNNLIVHRDIKPSNILIDAAGQLKVVDFGIAKLITKEEAPQKTTIMALTPSFAAPEQINSGTISVTTDVFSLAAVCLALLIEELPLPADRLLKSCADDEVHIWQTLKSQINDKDLRNILNQALQQDPHKRYRNMDLFADDLDAWLAKKPVMATPDSWAYRINKFAKRRSALFATILTLVLTLALSVVVLSWQYNKTAKEAQKALEVKNFMLNVFSVTNPDESQGESVSALDLLQRARVDIESTYQSDPKLKAELMLAIGTAFFHVGDWQEAQSILAEVYALEPDNIEAVLAYGEVLVALKQALQLDVLISANESLLNPEIDSRFQARTLRLLAAQKIFSGELDLAYEYLEKGKLIDLQNQQYPSLMATVTDMVKLAYEQSEYNRGIQMAEQAIASYEQHFPPSSTAIMKLKNELSVLYTKTGQFEKSQQVLEQMLELEQQYLGDEHPDTIKTMVSLSESYYSLGQLELARDMATQAHESTAAKFGASHPKVIEALNGLATVVFVQGDYEDALNIMTKAIAISATAFGEDHSDTLILKRNYATALGALRRNEEAKAVLLDVLDKQREALGEDHTETLYAKLSVVRVLGDLGEHDEAVKMGKEVMATFAEDPDRTGPIRSNAMYAMGMAYFNAEMFDQAIKQFKAIEEQNIESEETANFMIMCKTLSRSFLAVKDHVQAEFYARRALVLSEKLFGADNIRTTKMKLLLSQILLDSGQVELAAELLVEVRALVTAGEDRDRQQMLSRVQELEAKIQSE